MTLTIEGAKKKVIDLAISQDNYKEGRRNDNKYGAWFGMNHAPWCGAFVSWVFVTALGYKSTPLRGIQTPKGFMGTQLAARWAKMNKRLFKIPMVGDVVIWRKTATTGHTGIVTWTDGFSFNTMEGNTDPAQSRTGGMVNNHQHNVRDGKHDTLVGFIRPNWEKAVKIYNTPVR